MPDTRDADSKALRDNETQWNQDFAAKDGDKLVAHYADDAVLIGPGMTSDNGRDAIRKAWQGTTSDPSLALKFQPSKVEIARSRGIGHTQETYTLVMSDPATQTPVTDHGSYGGRLLEGRRRHGKPGIASRYAETVGYGLDRATQKLLTR